MLFFITVIFCSELPFQIIYVINKRQHERSKYEEVLFITSIVVDMTNGPKGKDYIFLMESRLIYGNQLDQFLQSILSRLNYYLLNYSWGHSLEKVKLVNYLDKREIFYRYLQQTIRICIFPTVFLFNNSIKNSAV